MQSFLFGTVLFVMLLAFCIAVYRHKKFPVVLKKITWYLLVELIAQAAVFSVLWYQGHNEYIIFHGSFVFEAVTLLLMYRELFKKYIEDKKQYVYRKIFIVLIVLFVVFAVVNVLCWQSINTYPSNTRTVLSLIIVIFSIQHHIMITARATRYYYLSGMNINISDYGDQKEIPAFKLTQAPMFWITTGLLLFHSVALLRYSFVNVLREELSKKSYTNISNVNSVFAVLLYIFIAIGLLKAKGIIFIKDDNNKTHNE